MCFLHRFSRNGLMCWEISLLSNNKENATHSPPDWEKPSGPLKDSLTTGFGNFCHFIWDSVKRSHYLPTSKVATQCHLAHIGYQCQGSTVPSCSHWLSVSRYSSVILLTLVTSVKAQEVKAARISLLTKDLESIPVSVSMLLMSGKNPDLRHTFFLWSEMNLTYFLLKPTGLK